VTHSSLYLQAGVLTLNGTFIVETVGFLLMLLFLARVPLPFLGIPKPVFPWIIDIAEARQRDITAKLQEAEKARAEAEARLREMQRNLEAHERAIRQFDGVRETPRRPPFSGGPVALLRLQRSGDYASERVSLDGAMAPPEIHPYQIPDRDPTR